MRMRFGWNLPSLSGWAVLLTYCTAATSIGCAAAPWERTVPNQQSAAVRPSQTRPVGYPAAAATPAPTVQRASTQVRAQGSSRGEHIAAGQITAPSTATGRDHHRAQRCYEMALSCWQQGDGDGTKRHLDEALAAHPRHREANLLLAEWCLLANCPDEAISRVAQLCRERPQDARAFHTLGTLLAAAGRDRDALALYERAAQLAPEDTMYQYTVDAASGHPKRGSDDLLTNNAPAEQAASTDSAALASTSYEPALLRLDGKAAAMVEPVEQEPRHLDSADLAAVEPISSTDPMDEHVEVFRVMTSPTARAAMLTGASNAKRSSSSDRVCSVCSSEPPSRFEPQSAQPLATANAAQEILPASSDRVRLRINRGTVSEADQASSETAVDSQVQKASADMAAPAASGSSLRLKTIGEDAPDASRATPRRTGFYGSSTAAPPERATSEAAVRSKPERAREMAVSRRSRVITPAQTTTTADYNALLTQAQQAFQADQVDQALRLLEQAAEATAMAEDREAAEVAVAVEAMRHAENGLAIELLEPAAARPDATARIFRTLGTAYYRAGAFPQAAEALERAVSLDSSSALSYFLLGTTLNKLGKQREAAEHLQRAAQLDPRYGDRR